MVNKMSEIRKIPAIRFKGFTDTWEKYNLKQVTLYRNGKGHEHLQSNIGDYELINLNSISIEGGLKPSGRFVKYSDNTLSKDDLVMVLSDVAHGYLLGRVALIPENNKYVLNQRVALLRPNGLLKPNYLFHIINNNQNYFKMQGAGSSQLNISRDSVENFSFLAPKSHEQSYVTTFFDKIDSYITLHQRKYEKLQQVKKALLEKMFPKDREVTPKIRFKGFSEAWKQYKFDEVVNRIATGLNPRDNFQLNTGGKNFYVTIKNFHHGNLRLDDDCDKVDDAALLLIQNRSDLKKNDILFSSIGRVGDCYLVDKSPEDWNINESVFTLRPNQQLVSPLYLFHTIHSDVVLSQILNNITGSTFKSIKVNDLKKAIVPTPLIDQQVKIGNFISSIENLITFHQRKYEKLQNIKKALLQKMFV